MAMSPQRPESRAACLPTGLAFSNCWSPERPASLAKQAVARRWLHRRCSLPEEPNAAARLSEMLRLDHPSEVRRTIVAEATRLLQLKSKGPSQLDPSQLETLLPGHRKEHPSRLGHTVGPSTVKLLMPLASNGGRDHHVAVRTSSWTHWSLSLLVGRAGPVVGLRGPYGSLCTCSGRVAPLSVASPSRRGGRTLLSPAVSSLSGRRPLPPARSWRP